MKYLAILMYIGIVFAIDIVLLPHITAPLDFPRWARVVWYVIVSAWIVIEILGLFLVIKLVGKEALMVQKN
ncbi:hypothetical protein [Enterococcus sp. LJL90]